MTITTTTYYIVRNAITGEPLQKMEKEKDAVNLAGYLNKKHNAEVAKVVKVTSTVETSVL